MIVMVLLTQSKHVPRLLKVSSKLRFGLALNIDSFMHCGPLTDLSTVSWGHICTCRDIADYAHIQNQVL